MKAPVSNYGNGGGGDWDSPAPGSYVGRCIKIIDLGTQDDTYKGEPKKVRKIVFMWELGASLIQGDGPMKGKPHIVSGKWSFSMGNKANLRKMIQSWAGVKAMTDEQAAEFDVGKLLGKNALVNLLESKKGNIFVDSVIKRPEAMPALPPVNEQVLVSLDPAEFKPEAYAKLSDHWKDIISLSPEFAQLSGKMPPANNDSKTPPAADDDIPF